MFFWLKNRHEQEKLQVLKMSSIFSHRRVIVHYNKDIFGCVCKLLSGKIIRRKG